MFEIHWGKGLVVRRDGVRVLGGINLVMTVDEMEVQMIVVCTEWDRALPPQRRSVAFDDI